MELGCDLEVDVNGEEIFMVNQKILASFSGLFRKLLNELTGTTGRLKVIFHNFPGGAAGFELIARFCYNDGTSMLSPSNVVLLNCVAHFMEMESDRADALNLVDQNEKVLGGIDFWTWSELLVALRQCQVLFPASDSTILLKILDSLMGRLASSTIASPLTCSSGNSSFQFSCDTTSICGTRNSCSLSTWWFEDLSFLNADLLDKMVQVMVVQKLDHAIIFRFLIFHLKFKFLSVTIEEKHKTAEVVINQLSLLSRRSLSCKGLFEVLRVVSSLKNISNPCKLKLESMIGSKLNEATLDHLLVPCPQKMCYMYDVDLVLRLVKAFLNEGRITPNDQLKKVASLVDSYLIEVAPDTLLKPSKFAELLLVLPDSARYSSDRLYQAIDIYLQVHSQLNVEEKMRVCCAVNHRKVSLQALKQLAHNSGFPSRAAVTMFINQQFNLNREEDAQQTLVSAKKESGLGSQLQGMQWKVTELEKVCRMLESRTSNVTKPRPNTQSKARSLPKLCP